MNPYHRGGIVNSYDFPDHGRMGWFLDTRTGGMKELYRGQLMAPPMNEEPPPPTGSKSS